MKAIILNSGIGKRMGILTRNKPKCLVKLTRDETILSRQVRLLAMNDVDEVIITTGPFESQIKEHVKSRFPDVSTMYVNNPCYLTTNYIYSLHLITREFTDDIILMHGDMVFDEHLINGLINSNYRNAAIVKNKGALPKKDFKCILENDLIRKIGVQISGSGCLPLMPVYKLSSEYFREWMVEIGRFIDREETSVYAENALNNILERLAVQAIYFDNDLCMEIDTVSDLELARNLIEKGD